MALPMRSYFPSLREITSPSAGFPKTFRTSLEKIQSWPCKMRARGLTIIPAIEEIQGVTLYIACNAQRINPLDVEPSALEFAAENANRHTILYRPPGNQKIAQRQSPRSV